MQCPCRGSVAGLKPTPILRHNRSAALDVLQSSPRPFHVLDKQKRRGALLLLGDVAAASNIGGCAPSNIPPYPSRRRESAPLPGYQSLGPVGTAIDTC